MSDINALHKKIVNLPLIQLMILCSSGLDTKMEDKRMDMLLVILETKLVERRINKVMKSMTRIEDEKTRNDLLKYANENKRTNL